MSDFKAFVEEVRRRSDIVDIIGADVKLRPAGNTLKGLSPFHEEKHPSFIVWPETQSWKDFSNGGGLGGDVFAYVQQRERIGFKDAVLRLAERAGVRQPKQDERAWRQQLQEMEDRRDVERLLTVAAYYYHSVLPAKIREELFKEHYGFTDETVDTLKLGWANGQLFDYLTEVEGVSREAALKTGLFVVLGGGRVQDFFRNRLVFPYWRGAQVVYFTARATAYTGSEEWEQSKYKKLLTHSDRHEYVSTTLRNDHFYNEDAARGADELVITEGVPDCISARQSSVSCISPATTSFRKQDVPKLLELTRRAKRVVICNDTEVSGAGDAGARLMAAALWAEGREVCIATIPLPDGKDKIDVNELVVSQGPEALREVLGRARGYPEYLLESIPQDAPTGDLDRLLEPVLTSLGSCSPIRRDGVLDAITARFGVRRRSLNTRLKELTPKKDAVPLEPSEGRVPRIRVNNRQLRAIVDDARAVLCEVNESRIQTAATSAFEEATAPLFLRGRSLVQLARADDGGAPMLSEVAEKDLYGMLNREADWVVQTEEGLGETFPPREVARDLHTFPPRSFPRVDSVITTPVFGRDGELLTQPGLHAKDRLWLEADPSLRLEPVPDNPTPEQVAAARSFFLDDLFVDFPFASESDKAHALAALLLPFTRRMIDGCTPLHVVEASGAGSGKGLTCNLISTIVTGEPCDARTLPESEDEVRKMISAELSKAQPIILIDNANEKLTLSSASLAAVLTTTSWTDRILGRTEMLRAPNKAMWMLTGNNPRLSKDLARRSVRIRIDPKMDRAWKRTSFKHNPILAWAKHNRSNLVHAALVLVQAWIAAGRPLGSEMIGSFEHWAAVMGGVLEVAGVQGFLGNLEELYEHADAEGEAWREFTLVWWERLGPEPVNVFELVQLCESQDLMLQVRGDGSNRSQQSRLGRALTGARDRVFGDFRVTVVKTDRKKRTVYALERLGGDPVVAPPAEAMEHVDADEVDPWA